MKAKAASWAGILALAGMAVVSGCNSASTIFSTDDAGRRIERQIRLSDPLPGIRPGQALAYVIRSEGGRLSGAFAVHLDGEVVGHVAGRSYIYIYLPPGKHKLWGRHDSHLGTAIDAKPEEIYYFIFETRGGEQVYDTSIRGRYAASMGYGSPITPYRYSVKALDPLEGAVLLADVRNQE